MWFHFRVQRNMPEWDSQPKPPGPARMSAVISLMSWLLVITFGRFIAYDWTNCGKPLPDWLNSAQECKASETGATDLKGNPL